MIETSFNGPKESKVGKISSSFIVLGTCKCSVLMQKASISSYRRE
jgi:hypothetical protein